VRLDFSFSVELQLTCSGTGSQQRERPEIGGRLEQAAGPQRKTPPLRLLDVVWTKSTLKPGDVITFYLRVAKNDAPRAILQKLALADGTVLKNRASVGTASRGLINDSDVCYKPKAK
jgi:hypothetical protein